MKFLKIAEPSLFSKRTYYFSRTSFRTPVDASMAHLSLQHALSIANFPLRHPVYRTVQHRCVLAVYRFIELMSLHLARPFNLLKCFFRNDDTCTLSHTYRSFWNQRRYAHGWLIKTALSYALWIAITPAVVATRYAAWESKETSVITLKPSRANFREAIGATRLAISEITRLKCSR